MMPRSDGQCLIYPGKTHSFHGESESGKSLILQAECARLVSSGQHVLYLDFEDDEVSVIGRLLQFGVRPDDILAHFDYRRPDSNPAGTPHDQRAWDDMLSQRYALCVIDGVTNCLSLFGLKTIDNDDLSEWQREVPDTIARHTGAGVAMVDHVTKSTDGRGRYAVGGQQKMNGLTGAAYTVEILHGPVSPGRKALLDLRVGKDRQGTVRTTSGPYCARDRTQRAAVVLIDSLTVSGHTTVTFQHWDSPTKTDDAVNGGEFKPTIVMELISKTLEGSDEPMSKTAACNQTDGSRRQVKLNAFDALVRERFRRGAISKARQSGQVTGEIPFRPGIQTPGTTLTKFLVVSGSGSKGGTGNQSQNQFREPFGNYWEPGTTQPVSPMPLEGWE